MKAIKLAMVMMAAGAMAAVSFAGDSVGAKLRTYCDPVCELRTQDAVFSLLVEAFREYHGYQIEKDYAYRVEAASQINVDRTGFFIEDHSPTMQRLQEFVMLLAGKERDLRVAHLQVQVENLETAYNCVRRRDERSIGQVVPSQVDTRAAAANLREFVIVKPGSLAKADLKNSKPVPATTVLLEPANVPLLPGQTVEPCTPNDQAIEFLPPEGVLETDMM